MPTNVTGLPAVVSGATRGVEASSPPNITQHRRDPIPTDYYNFNTGDLWINSQTDVQTPANSIYRLWVLMAKANYVATWVLIINGGGGPIVALQPAINGVPNGAVVTPTLGVIQINNTDGNIIPVAGVPNPNNLDLDFADTINVQDDINAGINGADGNITTYSDVTGLLQVVNHAASQQSGMVQMLKTRGTIQAPTVIITGDKLGQINFGGYDGTQFVFGASITSTSSGTIGANRVAGNLVFATHPDSTSGLTVPTTRGTISSAGNWTINAADAAGQTLNVGGTYNHAVGATQEMMVIDNAGNVGTNGAIAPGFQYATGTFVPGLTVGGSSVGITYSLQGGSYTRIGNTVLFCLTMGVTSLGGLTGDLIVTGLPFTVANTGNASQDCFTTMTGNFVFTIPTDSYLWSSAVVGTTTMAPQEGGEGTGDFLNDTNFTGTFSMTVVGHYFAV